MQVLTHHCSKTSENWECQMGDEEAALEEVDEVEQVTNISQSLI